MRLQLDEPSFGLKTSVILASSSSLVTGKSHILFFVFFSFFNTAKTFAWLGRAEHSPLRWLTLGFLEIALGFCRGGNAL